MTALSSDEETTRADLAPPRLIDGGGGEHERLLVAAARHDRVPSAAKVRVAASLGGMLTSSAEAPSLGAAAPEQPAGAGLPRLGAPAAFGIVGLGVGGAVALALWFHAESVPALPPPAALAPPAAVSLESTPEAALAAKPPSFEQPAPERPATLITSPVARQSSASVPSARTPATPNAPPAHAPASGNVPPSGNGLLAEVHALDAVSSALAAQQTERAARDLETYRRRFPKGELSIEADVLGIQLALARGDHARASALGEKLLAEPNAGRYRERVSALLRSKDAAGHIRARR